MVPPLRPTRPPIFAAPRTLPVAYDWATVPSLLPTKPPTMARALVTAPLAVDAVMLAPAPFKPTKPPTPPASSAFKPVTVPLALAAEIVPPLLPTSPPTLRRPLTAALLLTLSIVPLSTLPTSAPTFATPETLPPCRLRLRKVPSCKVPNRPTGES